MSARPRRRTRGQALVEFALTFPLWALLILSLLQLGLIFIEYYSEAQMALVGARWLAIHRNATDAEFTAYLQTRVLPGMIGGTPTPVQAGDSLGAPTIYRVGALTVTYTPCVLQSGFCTHTDRIPSNTLFVQTQYDISNILFLPAHYTIGFYSVDLPTTLPTYTVYKMVE